VQNTIRLLAALFLVTACSDGGTPPEGGRVTGEVHLLGNITPPPAAGVAQIYISVDDLDRRNPVIEVPLEGGPVDWTFDFEVVPVGRYYLGACFTFGCGDYSDIEGNPLALDVRSGETVTASITF
jgi:hypothetical protein